MQVRAYAERLLLATTLGDKLLAPPRLRDDRPGPAMDTVPTPGRPPELRLADPPRSSGPPRPGQLGDPRQVGRLLHAFANHELLAIELMALMLLRFPDAPPAFRRGLLTTLQEEQTHLGLYIDRLHQLGTPLGSVPVNGFFWRTMAPAPTAMDFVVRMAMVFEQANLDHCRHWARHLRAAGDAQSAAILDQVFDDERGHVGFGLHWFRRWKQPERSDWDEFCDRLTEPLSPSRAKGPGFQLAARLDLGLDPDFVQRLSIYGRSKGRPPVVWAFDPISEDRMVPGWRPGPPPKALRALTADLALLPALLAAQGDVLLVPTAPRPAFLGTLSDAGWVLPECLVCDPHGHSLPASLVGRRLGGLQPWSWDPHTIARLAPLGPTPQWDPARAQLATKGFAARLRPGFLDAWTDGGLVGPEGLGTVCTEPAQVAAILAGAPETKSWVCKAAFSASGRHRRRLGQTLDPTDLAWLESTLGIHGHVVLEPWLERVLDISFHFDLATDGAIKHVGTLRFETRPGGGFRAAHLGPLTAGLATPLARFLHRDGKDPRWLGRLAAALGRHLGPALAAAQYTGPVGVDAFVLRTPDGGLAMQPLCEINPRWTMGRVGLAMAGLLAPGTRGRWAVHPISQLPGRDPRAWAAQLPPVVLRAGRISGGALPTTDPQQAQAVMGVLWAGSAALAG